MEFVIATLIALIAISAVDLKTELISMEMAIEAISIATMLNDVDKGGAACVEGCCLPSDVVSAMRGRARST